MLGYAAASDVFGASLYEPCGQIDQTGNLFAATATNRDIGGYHDKIDELRWEGQRFPLPRLRSRRAPVWSREKLGFSPSAPGDQDHTHAKDHEGNDVKIQPPPHDRSIRRSL